ncbi:MAG: gamma-glutamyl-gamma-aminobutyrate hydrolase family protein [Gemmatimonadaceae bacterium]
MQARPVIGVTTQTQEAIPNELPKCWIMGQRYVGVLTSFGAVPWLIPLLDDDEATLRAIYERLDGVFLPGGADIDPASYGEEKCSTCGSTDPARDRTELALVRWAAEDGKPVLAVCRGEQILNVAGGGTLYQDLSAHREGSIKHDYFPSEGGYTREHRSHSVSIPSGTLLSRLVEDDTVHVNSMHHQGIKDLAPTLVASAIAPDGVIEGVEAANGQFMIGVQWHPENLVDSDPRMHRLFEAFFEAALEFRDKGK